MTKGIKAPVSERIKQYVQPVESGCHEWGGGLDKDGYALITDEGVCRRAARVAYRLAHGEIPPGLQIDHLCRNKSCVNPEHLEAVTAWENNRRSDSPSARNMRKTCCNHGHEFDDENTHIVHRSDGRTERCCKICRQMAADRYKRKRESVGAA